MRILRYQTGFVAATLAGLLMGLTLSASGEDQRKLPPSKPAVSLPSSQPEEISIPGPLRSLLRMAGISQKISAEEVVPELAHSVFSLGYNNGQETEFLFLLQRYVRQARDLQAMSINGEIRIDHCADAGPLLQVLGYRLHNECGHKDAALFTLNPENAFLTIDSGFPLTKLEQALQTDTPFVYPYAPSRVPLILKKTSWVNVGASRKYPYQDVLDLLLHDQHVARLYWALSKMDSETVADLEHSPGLVALLPYCSALDFYGTQLGIRSKRVLVPGGEAAESEWKDLVGASPRSPGEFVLKLVSTDRGWMAAYYDTLARVGQTQQTHLTQSPRLRRLYAALHGSGPDIYAAGATFRKAPGLLMLFNRQPWTANGEPRIPGTLEVWRQVLGRHGKHVGTPEQLLEAMVSCARLETDDGPLQIYLSLSALDGARPPQKKISPETLVLLANDYPQYNNWYPIFSEFNELSDVSITRFLHLAGAIDRISNPELRGDTLGVFQANIGIWQIFARQGEISRGQLDASWQKTMEPFDKVGSPVQLLDAGEKSLGEVMLAATGKPDHYQDAVIEALAGPPQKNQQGKHVRSEMARKIRSVMEDQRLTSLDTLVELNNGLAAMAHGNPRSERLLSLAGDLREFELPRPIFTESEKFEWAPDVARQRHAGLQVHTDLAKIIENPGPPAKLEAARGQLAPFLRDTLVGLNYAYYEPPGSQILHINPMFVRSHDFAGVTIVGEKHVWDAPMLFGTGISAGGGAYLVGSLADLPYVLAGAEQNFISPENVQALIWQELVPSLLASATLSRWWNVTPREMHAVALYQQAGEELVAASTGNAETRDRVVAILGDRMPPQQLSKFQASLQYGTPADSLNALTPADTFYVAAEFRKRFPEENGSAGPAFKALDQLTRQDPAEVSVERISRDFGNPHPTFEQTYGRQLVNSKPFPAFSGIPNRLFGESWDSNNLYWARLADERNDSPEVLNILSPQLTRLMISKIFATDIEDWPAVARAMREAGNDLMQGKVALLTKIETSARPQVQ